MTGRLTLKRALPVHARWLVIAAAVVVVVLGAGFLILLAHWPFTQAAVEKALGQKLTGAVGVKSFHRLYFPHPGCVAEGVTVRRDGDKTAPPVLEARKLTVQGSYTGLFSHHVDRIRAEGLALRVPPGGFHAPSGGQSKLTVGEMVADGAVLETAARPPNAEPLRFVFRELSFGPVGKGDVVRFRTTLENPKPAGELRASGQFGPMPAGETGAAPISGSYTFAHADLGVFHGLAGTLSSKGKFKGVLRRIEVDGETEVPDFEVTRSQHATGMSAQFHAVVNGTDGDTLLETVDAHFRGTEILSHGAVEGKTGERGMTLVLDMTSHDGRIQDLLRLFVRGDRPPMTGAVSFRARATLPPENRPFIRKVTLQGDFGIGGGQFPNPKTQGNVNRLSEHARGDTEDDADPQSVISNLRGHVALRDGIARLSNISFSIPGALARMQGTYSLIDKQVDLHGTLQMNAKLSESTSGVKSFLLKAIDPFFKKKNRPTVVPVHITGKYPHASFGVDLLGKK